MQTSVRLWQTASRTRVTLRVRSDLARPGGFGPPILNPLGSVDNVYQLFDPTTARFVSGANGSGIVETPFPGNIIPFSRMDPSALKYQAFFIAPTTAGKVNNSLQPAFSNYRHTTIPSIKIDQNISSKMKVSGYYSQTYTYSPNANGYTNLEEPATPQDQRSQTIRANFDDTLTPTLLLHVGVGLLYFDQPEYPPSVNAGQLLGWSASQQYPANNFMPNLGGLSSFFAGGLAVGGLFGGPGVGFAADQDEKEYKPTANVNMTWVKGNHTFKWGGEMVVEGFPTQSSSRANALYGFSGNETSESLGYTSSNASLGASDVFTSGFPYASFLLGSVDSLNASAITDTRLGKHALGFFAQDNWKITRKLTLELGLRYDYTTTAGGGARAHAERQLPDAESEPGSGGFHHPVARHSGLPEAVQSQLSVTRLDRALEWPTRSIPRRCSAQAEASLTQPLAAMPACRAPMPTSLARLPRREPARASAAPARAPIYPVSDSRMEIRLLPATDLAMRSSRPPSTASPPGTPSPPFPHRLPVRVAAPPLP